MKKKLTALVIMDGYGLSDELEGNAVKAAKTPNIDRYMKEYPSGWIKASGLDVGLPEGQMGNSEVGHLNIGAGRIVYQDLTRVSKSIVDGDFFENEALLKAVDNALDKGTDLHLLGLVSDGGVHSHLDHLYALVELAKDRGLDRVYIHAFMDGRDVPPTSGKGFIEDLDKKLGEIGIGKIATISGRYYAMDRDNRWERVERAYDALVLGQGLEAEDGAKAMAESYARDVTDEFIDPIVLFEDGQPISTIDKDDSIIFFNFRPDRAREITRSLIEPDFDGFSRSKGYFPLTYITMTEYDKTFENVDIAFGPENIENTLGEYISNKGKKQLRLAETEKYAHVTFFFNGGVEAPNEGEDRVLVPSPKVATYDLKPSMSALEVTEEMIARVKSEEYDLIILNYANCDMVGHTGIMEAAVEAVETVDACVARVVDAIREVDGNLIITADHGNAEMMLDKKTGGVHTAHTSNPVPFIYIDNSRKDASILEGGRLSDLAPTLLELMGLDKPAEMTGKNLIK